MTAIDLTVTQQPIVLEDRTEGVTLTVGGDPVVLQVGDWLGVQGGGAATPIVVDAVGAFGPGFDFLAANGWPPFGSLPWGPTHVLASGPTGVQHTFQVPEGGTVVCAAYMEADFSQPAPKEGVWDVIGGTFVQRDPQPPAGTIVAVRDMLGSSGGWDWGLAAIMVATPEGRWELPLLQYLRPIMGRGSAVATLSADAELGDTGAGYLGVVIIDTAAGPVTVTLPAVVESNRGRSFYLRRVGPHVATVASASGIDGVSSFVLPAGQTVEVCNDGVAWSRMDRYSPANPANWTAPAPSTIADGIDALANRSNVIALGPADPIPPGTPVGTIIIREEA